MKLEISRSYCLIMAIIGTSSNMFRLSRVYGFGVTRRRAAITMNPIQRIARDSRAQVRLLSTSTSTPTTTFTAARSARTPSSSSPILSSTSRLFMSTTTTETVTTPAFTIKSIDFVEEAVLEALNDLFDPAEVARGAALAKLNKPKKQKKKKKKKQGTEDVSAEKVVVEEVVEVEEKVITEEEKQAIGDAAAANAKPFSKADTMVTLATKAEFGDYQVNAAMGLSKYVGMNPRECAAKIAEAILPKIGDCMGEPEIAGPGFINLRFTNDYLTSAAQAMAEDAAGRLAQPTVSNPQKIVVDYSSPNIAKEMHVGHLRSTIIGDTLSNMLEFVGHDVVRLNHVGDWGTQFGMLVEHLRDEYPAALTLETSQDVELGDLVLLYKAAKKRFDWDEDFKKRAREGVVKLQAGNEEELAAWKALCAASRVEYQKIYDTLNIKNLTERGESFYNPYLNEVVEDLEGQGLAVQSEGATAVFLDGVSNNNASFENVYVLLLVTLLNYCNKYVYLNEQ